MLTDFLLHFCKKNFLNVAVASLGCSSSSSPMLQLAFTLGKSVVVAHIYLVMWVGKELSEQFFDLVDSKCWLSIYSVISLMMVFLTADDRFFFSQ